jgi:hypothetical protein
VCARARAHASLASRTATSMPGNCKSDVATLSGNHESTRDEARRRRRSADP